MVAGGGPARPGLGPADLRAGGVGVQRGGGAASGPRAGGRQGRKKEGGV